MECSLLVFALVKAFISRCDVEENLKEKKKRTCSLNALFLRLSLSLENVSIKCFKIRLNLVVPVLLLLLECLETSSFVIFPFVFFVFCLV